LEMEHLSLYTGYMMETRRDSSYTEDSETCNGRFWKQTFLLYGSMR